MGNAMGNVPSNGINSYLSPEVTPAAYVKPTFDPKLGFVKDRKERKMLAKEEELKSAKIALKDRDYCSHLLLHFRACRKDAWPFVVKCEHEKHAYLNCQYHDFMLRMKEYERERRLLVRQQKMKAVGA